jgi:hypothetical protein
MFGPTPHDPVAAAYDRILITRPALGAEFSLTLLGHWHRGKPKNTTKKAACFT